MEGYNTPKDLGYKIESNYGPVRQTDIGSNTYGGQQTPISTLPIYQDNKPQNLNLKSRCPNGAALNKIGSACGNTCTRACAIPS